MVIRRLISRGGHLSHTHLLPVEARLEAGRSGKANKHQVPVVIQPIRPLPLHTSAESLLRWPPPHPHPHTSHYALPYPYPPSSTLLSHLPAASQQVASLFILTPSRTLLVSHSLSSISLHSETLSPAFLSPLSRSFLSTTNSLDPSLRRALTGVRNSQRTDRSDISADQPSSTLQLSRSSRLLYILLRPDLRFNRLRT